MAIKINGLASQSFEYQMVLELPADLCRKIERVRVQLSEKYCIQQPPTGRPNVSLVRFKAHEMMEKKIINKLRQVVFKEKPFTVRLRDYGSYPMHALFIEIENQARVLELIKQLKQARQLMKVGLDEPHFLIDPQMVLAGRLASDKFIDIMNEYEHKRFAADFLADSLLLLRKSEKKKRYEVVKHFEFEDSHVRILQKQLF